MKTEGESYHRRQACARNDRAIRGFKKKARTKVAESLSFSQTRVPPLRTAKPGQRSARSICAFPFSLRSEMISPMLPLRHPDEAIVIANLKIAFFLRKGNHQQIDG